jgi:RNA polymerase sigma-70 factor (ECF subfamily)
MTSLGAGSASSIGGRALLLVPVRSGGAALEGVVGVLDVLRRSGDHAPRRDTARPRQMSQDRPHTDEAHGAGVSDSVDTALVQLAAGGDREAFAQLYRAYADAVYRYALLRVRDIQAAEDVTQEVFVRAYRSMAQLRDPASFRSWLMRICHNCVATHIEQQARRPETAVSPEASVWRAPREGEQQPARDPASALDLQTVLAACENLTELQRQVIALRFVSGLSVAETAAIMGRTPNAIHNLQHHALAGLRRQLASDEDQRTRGKHDRIP